MTRESAAAVRRAAKEASWCDILRVLIEHSKNDMEPEETIIKLERIYLDYRHTVIESGRSAN